MSQRLLIPDTLKSWKWQRSVNPNLEQVRKESYSWLLSFQALSPGSQRAFEKCRFDLLAGLAYPNVSREVLRVACDLMYLFFIIDDFTDNMEPDKVLTTISIVVDAIRRPEKPRPDGEWVIGEIARQFWANAVACITISSRKHFVTTFTHYLFAVVEEARDRASGRQHSVESFMELRRETVGFYPSLAVLEMEKGTQLSDDVLQHPLVLAMTAAATNMICIGNDLVSYNKEQALGGANHNIVSIVMSTAHVGTQDALNWAAGLFSENEHRFMDAYADFRAMLPRWGDAVDAAAIAYVDGIANWVRASDQWSYESERYFGSRGLDVQHSGWCELLPKRKPAPEYRLPVV